ncbi:NADH dehydrogenase [Collibacillus ludicampi]|uniref:NADH dehydrogenase n=1 Tax=Collibacillus ludicampi TaxID=2771369 RepID=A0AAV4LB24_9BACL|nr:NAD(P)/FAD-dependent oxidoreductase [Collibacillus ludicampi]GIM44863.1 NADH dehydrogenase [Collibacillus ludicampi]
MAKKVVILGAGYAGLVTALKLNKLASAGDCEIILVNKHDYHQMITQLHESAAGAKSDRDIRIPLASVLKGKNIKFIKDTVEAIDKQAKQVKLKSQVLSYDYLVVSLGSESEYFGIPGLKEYSFSLKSINQARLIRIHIEKCFADYHYDPTPDKLTFVVGGAGFSGIELVGELADALPKLAEENNIPYERVKLYNVEAAPMILPGFDEELVKVAEHSLKSRGVNFLVGVPIIRVEPGKVHLKNGEIIETQTLVWTGGVRGSQIVIDAGFETEPRGRAKVDEYLRAIGHEDVFIIGDSCFVMNEETGRPYPPTAQIAIQMGENCAANLYASIKGTQKEKFVPNLLGSVASLGRKDAIGKVGKSLKTKGWIAYRIKDMSQVRYLAKIGMIFK